MDAQGSPNGLCPLLHARQPVGETVFLSGIEASPVVFDLQEVAIGRGHFESCRSAFTTSSGQRPAAGAASGCLLVW